MNEDQKNAARSALDAIVAAAQGRHIDAVRHLAEGALELVPGEVFKQIVSDAIVRKASRIGDAIEDARFGTER